MTPPTPIARLRLGQKVTVQGVPGIVVGIMDYSLVPGENGAGISFVGNNDPCPRFVGIEDVTPVVRGLDTLTEEECREVFRLAFRRKPSATDFYWRAHLSMLVVRTCEYGLSISSGTNTVSMCPTGFFADSGESCTFRAVAVIDYLDSLGVAIRGEKVN